MDLKRLARFVEETRKQKGLSQPEVMRRGGPSDSWISSLELGSLPSEPKRSTLQKLAKGLGLPLDDVLREAGLATGSPQETFERFERYLNETAFPTLSYLRETMMDAERYLKSLAGLDPGSLSPEQLAKAAEAIAVIKTSSTKVQEIDKELSKVAGISAGQLERFYGLFGLDSRQHGLKALDGGLDIPLDVPDPPDEWELSVLEKTGALRSQDYSKDSDFWYLPREDRRALLRNLEDVWFEDQRLRKKIAEQRSWKRA